MSDFKIVKELSLHVLLLNKHDKDFLKALTVPCNMRQSSRLGRPEIDCFDYISLSNGSRVSPPRVCNSPLLLTCDIQEKDVFPQHFFTLFICGSFHAKSTRPSAIIDSERFCSNFAEFLYPIKVYPTSQVLWQTER